MIKIDFDEWANLYQTDPVEFERKRRETIDKAILDAPVKVRNQLRLLQLECDTYHETLSPVEATIAISELMLSKAAQISSRLDSLNQTLNRPDQ